MEMDSSRRSFDRSREPGLKKPRLAMEDPNVRQFQQRPTISGSGPMQSRYGTVDRDMDSNDSGRGGGGYQPLPLAQHQQHQELVEQYRTALAELTFNSKPIITNLTIIAGENQHAAKAIAATVCANILEVPSDQKLPSLYLLDSIVKNIGRDYIKYFAARLPEVFCRAYRQVDPPVHTSMRHLFGTWKGVFHPQTLQMIEKELGIGSSANGSSAPATSRSESQSQRPAHSIHVNPKYLERQRLQQSVRPKSISNDMGVELINASEDAERLERTPGISTGRSWMDTPSKIPSIQRSDRETLHDPIRDKNIGAVYGDLEYGSEISRNSGLGVGRGGSKATDQGQGKSWYGAAGGDIADSISSQRNGFPMKQRLPSYPPPKSSNIDAQIQPAHGIGKRTGSGLSTSWKNSEEEEFMWDSMDSRSTDHGMTNISSISRKDQWTADGLEKPVTGNNLRLRKPTKEGRNNIGALNKSGLSDGYPATVGGIPITGSSLSRVGTGPQARSSHLVSASMGISGAAASGSSGAIGQQRIPSIGSASPSRQSPMHQHPPSPSDMTRFPRQQLQSLAEHDYAPPRTDPKATQFSTKLSIGQSNQYGDDSLPIPSSAAFRLKALDSKVASPSRLPVHLKQHPSALHQQQTDRALPDSFGQSKKPLQPASSGHKSVSVGTISAAENPVPSAAAGSLLAAIARSGNISASSPDEEALMSQSGVGPPMSSASLPIQLPFSGLTAAALSALRTSLDTGASQGKIGQQPVPPGPPAPSTPATGSASEPSANVTKSTSNPIANLLSTLVEKGLISAVKTESSSPVPSQTPKQLQNGNQDVLSSLIAKGLISAAKAEEAPTSVPSRMNKQLQDETQDVTTASPVSSASVPTSVPASVPTSVPASVPTSVPASTTDEVSTPEPAAGSSELPQPTAVEIKNLIGYEFRPDVIRNFHSSVVDDLFHDLPHQCSICGLKLKLKECLDRHLVWHASQNLEQKDTVDLADKWYMNSVDWVAGRRMQLSLEDESAIKLEEKSEETAVIDDPVVPADETQCACLLCGELFEDMYSIEQDEWMFKGAVHMVVPSEDSKLGSENESNIQGPIVHANCLSKTSVQDLLLGNGIKMEVDA